MIHIREDSKTFRIHRKAPGLRGPIRSLFHRQWEDKHSLNDVSLDVKAGEIMGPAQRQRRGQDHPRQDHCGDHISQARTVSILGHTPWYRNIEFRHGISLIMGQKAQLPWDLPGADGGGVNRFDREGANTTLSSAVATTAPRLPNVISDGMLEY